jgi:hypothetical protein
LPDVKKASVSYSLGWIVQPHSTPEKGMEKALNFQPNNIMKDALELSKF